MKLFDAIKMGNDNCPYCGKLIDMASSVESPEDKPRPKDFSVCIGCAGVMRYGNDMALEECPDIVIESLPEKERQQILIVVQTIKRMNAKKRSGQP